MMRLVISVFLIVVFSGMAMCQSESIEDVSVGDTIVILKPSFDGQFADVYLNFMGKKYPVGDDYWNTKQIVMKVKVKKGIVIASRPNTPKGYEVHVKWNDAVKNEEVGLKVED